MIKELAYNFESWTLVSTINTAGRNSSKPSTRGFNIEKHRRNSRQENLLENWTNSAYKINFSSV